MNASYVLDNSFIHLPDFGPKREWKLWSRGILTWDDFLDHFGGSPYNQNQCSIVASSKYALHDRNPGYFAMALPSSQTWRAYPHFDRIAYLDIETTGLSPATDYATVVGLFDGKKTRSYIHGQNLTDLEKDIADFDMVITFNGSMFDIPFLRRTMKNIRIPPLHADLRFVLASMNVRGGLKKIEKQFSLEREDDLKGLTGYDAVLLWRRYMRKRDRDALDKLVRYNAADIENLKFLMDWAYKEKRKQTGLDDFC